MKQHRLLPNEHFQMLYEGYRGLVAKTLEQLETGVGVPQRCYRTLLEMSLSNGCIALILGQGDEIARAEFAASAAYALKLLRAPGARGARSYEAHVALPETGVTALHEIVPALGSEKLSITDYHEALLSIVAFGDQSDFSAVGAVEEEQYRSPGTIAGEEYWLNLRSWKALLRGDEAGASRQARMCLDKAKDAALRAQATAFLALLAGDGMALRQALANRLEAHQKLVRKEPNNPLGVVCLPALALCRTAIERGMSLEEIPYLPLRLLPSFKPPVR